MGRRLHDRIKDFGFEVWSLSFVDASTLKIVDVDKFEAAENSGKLGGYLFVPLASVPEVIGEDYHPEPNERTSVLYTRDMSQRH